MPEKYKLSIIRIPDKPRLVDFELIGRGTDSLDESSFGDLVLDEVGTWFNSRKWQDKGRQEIIDWCLHARKLGWNVYIIVQDMSLVDNQLRDSLCEHLVVCRRMDRLPLPIPFIGRLFSTRMPKIHVATVYYGDSDKAMKVTRWWYVGKKYYKSYNTNQKFTDNNEWVSNSFLDASNTEFKRFIVDTNNDVLFDFRSCYSVLTPFYTLGKGLLSDLESQRDLVISNRAKLLRGERVSLVQNLSSSKVKQDSSFIKFSSSRGRLVKLGGVFFAFLVGFLIYSFFHKPTTVVANSKESPKKESSKLAANSKDSSKPVTTNSKELPKSTIPNSKESAPANKRTFDFNNANLVFVTRIGDKYDYMVRLSNSELVTKEQLAAAGYFVKVLSRSVYVYSPPSATSSRVLVAVLTVYSLPALPDKDTVLLTKK